MQESSIYAARCSRRKLFSNTFQNKCQGETYMHEYEIGDLVSKPVTGICKIEDILYLNPQDEKNDKLYYYK